MKVILVVLALSLSVFGQTKPTHIKEPVHKKELGARATGPHTIAVGGCADTTSGVSYNFYIGTTAGAESTTPSNPLPLTTCSYTFSGLTGLTTYYMTVKAYLATASPSLSGPSNEVNATTTADAQPAAPTGLTVGTVAGNRIPLMWKAPQKQTGYDVVAYEIKRGTNPTLPGGSLIGIVPEWTLSYTDNGCTKTCYYEVESYTIEADNKYVLSPPSNVVKGTIQ